ncbi:MAG TPA: 2-oxo acid dehydrogenase subunit E2 [Polyangiales bacterium]|nr:2-oxo acid dehydrogenase subunit E2 [Polyangiales bacterium]
MSAWRRPSDPSVYGWLDVDVSRALPYLDGLAGPNTPKVTLTHLVGKAVALAIADCPSVNAIVRRDEVYTRDRIDVFFQVAYEHGENLSGAAIEAADRKPLVEIARELAARARDIRAHDRHSLSGSDALISRIPAPLRRYALRAVESAVYDWGLDLSRFGVPSDAFGSAMVTNVGVFGLQHGFAPLVPFSRVPIVVTVGSVRDAAVVEAGAVAIRPVLSIGVTLDHRVLDGYQAGKLARRFEEVLRDPGVALR